MERKQPNKWGVYEDLSCECLAIPLNKKHKSGLLVCVACASDGLWRFGFSCAIKTGGQSSPVSDSGLPFTTRGQAILAGIDKLSSIVNCHSNLTKAEITVYTDAIKEFALEFQPPETPEQPEPTFEQPLQVEILRPRKTAYLCGWMSAELPDRPSAQLYIFKQRKDWGVTYEPAEASRFKTVESVLEWYGTNGSVHGDPETNSYNGHLKIFEDGPGGLRLVPCPTRQTSLFDNLPPLEIIETQPDLIKTRAATICYSPDETKILASGFSLVRYDREAKTVQCNFVDNPDKGWAPAVPFNTYAAAEKTLKEMLQLATVVEVSLDGKANMTTSSKKLFAAGFEFYRSEGIVPGHGYPRIKQYSKNWGTWQKYETPEQCQAAWDELMQDQIALQG